MTNSIFLRPSKDAQCIKPLYFSSFPEDERRPWENLCQKTSTGKINLRLIMAEGEVAGFFTFWRLPNGIRYIEHLATEPRLRGKGIGAKALALFIGEEPEQPVLVEVERPDFSADARRRIGFYERCGFMAHPSYDYVQPPYSADLQPVPLLLMSTGEIDTAKCARALHETVYGVKA